MKLHETEAALVERALLVGLERPGHDRWAEQDSLAELRELAESAGVEVLDVVIQKRAVPCAPTFIGTGKAEELAERCRRLGANMVIFDDDLTPAQGRNLGEILGPNIKVIDRTELILDIFAQRARTREGKIQVELAQMQYMLPRLTGLWTHLSRQRGGVGCRGPGETQLEVDRRRVQEKITRLQRQLLEVRQNRRIERSGRQRLHWPVVSLVGYTNSGKSTLMNALTGAGVLAEDKLFATLDPTTRRLRLPNNQNVLLTDTVGFIRKLPHHLVESFNATLEEVVEADLLLHVVDVSHPQAHEHIKAVEHVLHDIGAGRKPTVLALNKIDRLTDEVILNRFHRDHPTAVPISARYGTNLDQLLEELVLRLRDWRVDVELHIPHDRARTISLVYQSGYVRSRRLENGAVILEAQIPKMLAGELAPFIVRTA
ncbi:MAG: GTPase HflX [Verrucomicrobiae bacterium]|nr:GTPase HflX [Verrucomicrobiae bacterium]MDW8343097.1 GTPase HflX [Verrucomicrobiae bacterium]